MADHVINIAEETPDQRRTRRRSEELAKKARKQRDDEERMKRFYEKDATPYYTLLANLSTARSTSLFLLLGFLTSIYVAECCLALLLLDTSRKTSFCQHRFLFFVYSIGPSLGFLSGCVYTGAKLVKNSHQSLMLQRKAIRDDKVKAVWIRDTTPKLRVYLTILYLIIGFGVGITRILQVLSFIIQFAHDCPIPK